MHNEKTEILFGIHSVFEAIKAKRRKIYKIYISKEKNKFKEIFNYAKKNKIHIEFIKNNEIKKIANNEHTQGIAIKTSCFTFSSFEEISEIKKPFLLMLDHLLDSHNFGAITRSALCVGVDGIIIPKNRAVMPAPIISKISAGALEHMKIIRVTNLARSIETLKKKGLWVFGLDTKASQNIYEKKIFSTSIAYHRQ